MTHAHIVRVMNRRKEAILRDIEKTLGLKPRSLRVCRSCGRVLKQREECSLCAS